MAPVIAVPERLAPPKAVEVIPAGSVDARVTAIAVEIRQLEAEARDLDEEATRLERQAGESRRRVEESDSVLPMLEAVFGEQADATRCDLRAALNQAEERAQRRVEAARAEAKGIVAEAAAVAGSTIEAATTHQGANGVASFRQWSRFPPPVAEAPVRERPAAPPSTPPVEDAPVAESPWRPPPEASPAPEPEPTVVMRPTIPEPSPMPAAVGPLASVDAYAEALAPTPPPTPVEPAHFAQFWTPDTDSGPRQPKPAILDAVLPLIAVAIVVIVVLSWIG